MFEASTYIQRRARLRKDVKSGIIILMGNNESPMNYTDNTYHFRQDSTFLYFFGLDFSGLVGIIDIDGQTDYLFGNDYTIDDIVWMGKQMTINELGSRSGISKTASLDKLDEEIRLAKDQNRQIHFLPPYRAENCIRLFHWLGINPKEIKQKASVELIKAVVNQRIIKSQEEIDEIEKAIMVSAEMHLTAMHSLRPGMMEAEMMAVVSKVAFEHNCNLAFPVIATKNGQTLHNSYHGNTVRKGELFLLDSGAESSMHYAGDLSSTFPVDIKFTDKQKEIYQISLNAHNHAVSLLKPGVNFRDIHLSTCKVIAEGMKEAGFIRGNVDDAVNEGAHAIFFPCGIGHMLGLDVHDMEDLGELYVGYDGQNTRSKQFGLKSLRLTRPLQPGFVLTIEPGIYFIPDLIDKWWAEKKFAEFLNYEKLEKYKDFGGIRNEENYLITETSARLLGKELPKTIEKVERERAKSV